jgi:hypothetical protein
VKQAPDDGGLREDDARMQRCLLRTSKPYGSLSRNEAAFDQASIVLDEPAASAVLTDEQNMFRV